MASHRLWMTISCGPLGEAQVLTGMVEESLDTSTHSELVVLMAKEVDLESLLDQEATVKIGREEEALRTWHLLVTEARWTGSTRAATAQEQHRYELLLDSPIDRLKLRKDVRMFQEMTAKEIVEKVFVGAGIPASKLSWQLSRDPVKRTYCVQHRESDWSFVRRLLEHEGIFWFLEEADDWKLVLADSKDAFKPIEGEAEVPLVQGRETHAGIFELTVEHHWVPDQIVLRDYNYEKPGVDLTCTAKIGASVQGERFEFPGGYQTPAEGNDLVKIRGEELAAGKITALGESSVHAFTPGATFTLTGASRGDLNTDYLVRRARHVVREPDAKGARYRNAFLCSPKDQPYRPVRSTAPSRVHGSESVVVAGPSGEEIYTEDLGRMKGKFFWDRVGTDPATASTWMRVAQLPIGGSMALARVGWEMAVRFQYGDPDRPVAVARVDNGDHKAPYTYPAAASAMSFKTLSSPASGKFNEFTMEDGGGGMKFGVNASKDWNENVTNNKTEKIGVDEKLDVGVDQNISVVSAQKIEVGASHTKTVGAEQGINITGDKTKSVGAAETVTVSGTLDEKVKGADSETVGASRTSLAAMGVSRTSQGNTSLTVGAAMLSAAGMGCSFAVAGSKSETVGAAKIIASGASVSETILGAGAVTVGGVCLNLASGNRASGAKGASVLTVGGVALANAAGKIQMKAKSIKILVAGAANLLGGGGILNMTPGSASFVGLVTIKASGSLKISGAPNLVG